MIWNIITYMEGFAGKPSFARAFPHKLDPVRFESLLAALDVWTLLPGAFSFLALILFKSSILKSSGFLNFWNQRKKNEFHTRLFAITIFFPLINCTVLKSNFWTYLFKISVRAYTCSTSITRIICVYTSNCFVIWMNYWK